ncbi:hypothetical protein V7147_06405 [Bacillus sp. JJ1521]|uniref:hypothetical protein n=1 Tax=Bacillus sp. JJ1521 TaxID=3122957 RepID=UPI002FFF4618
MSEHKKERVIHVDNLIIHAKNVEFIDERKEENDHRRGPWDFFWGRRQWNEEQVESQELELEENND